MTSSMRHLARPLLTACVLAVAAGSASLRAGQAPAAPASTPTASPGPSAPVRIERFVDRVWIVDAATTVAPGSRYVFLADNVLVIAPKGAAAIVGTWAEDVDGLVMTEKGRTSKVDVLELTPTRFRMRIKVLKAATEVTLVPAIEPPPPPPPVPTAAAPSSPAAPAAPPVAAPLGSPYRCGGDTFRVAFEADKAYLTWPDNSVIVLTETRGADSSASRRTYTDGQYKVVEDTSESFTRVFFARPGFRPRPCSSTR